MRYLKIIAVLLLAFSASNMAAQKTNAEKILGCWTFKTIEFNGQYDFSEELIKQTNNTVVCFSPDGKFTTDKSGSNSASINGSYSISADGKTLNQKRDISEAETVDEGAEITLLNEKQLHFKLDFGTMCFERK